MDWPDSMRQIAVRAAANNRGDYEGAVEAAKRLWKKSPDRDKWIDSLEGRAIRSLVSEQLSKSQSASTREQRASHSIPKVTLSTGAANRAAASAILDTYSIRGKLLGDIRGAELPEIADSEHTEAGERIFNALVCEELASLVPGFKRVRDAVDEQTVQDIFSAVRERQYGEVRRAAKTG